MNIFKKFGIDRGVVERTIVHHLATIRKALAEEQEASKRMFAIFYRHSQGQATDAEMEEANKQFRSLLKTIGLGALCILPGSVIAIPAVARLGEKYGIDIWPDSFKKDEPS